MFSFKKNKISSEIPLITEGFRALLYDDEPVLYSGKNKYGSYILGSSIDEDYDNNLEWFFHVLIDFDAYVQFLKQKISYFEILKNSNDIYIIEKALNPNTSSVNIYMIKFSEIDEDYLPTEDSFCPDPYLFSYVHAPYSLRLQGLEEDTFRVNTRSLRNVLENFPKIVDSAIAILDKAFDGLTGVPYVEAFQGGSFVVNFDFKLDRKTDQMSLYELLPNFEDEVRILLNKYIDYCFNTLPDELSNVLLQKDAPEFNRIFNEFEAFIAMGAMSGISTEGIESKFTDETKKVPEIISDLTDDIGVSFDFIELSSVQPIIKIDSNKKKNYDFMIGVIEKQFVDIDPTPMDYKIHIYSLNVDSRKGKANVIKTDDPDAMVNPRIKIEGTEPLENSKYTGSLHENKFITVKGIGKREDAILKSIDILFESE
ncbi:hypothetical protein ACFL7M_13650 [Thermodesulfobacteriota bacterium]